MNIYVLVIGQKPIVAIAAMDLASAERIALDPAILDDFKRFGIWDQTFSPVVRLASEEEKEEVLAKREIIEPNVRPGETWSMFLLGEEDTFDHDPED